MHQGLSRCHMGKYNAHGQSHMLVSFSGNNSLGYHELSGQAVKTELLSFGSGLEANIPTGSAKPPQDVIKRFLFF